MADRWTAQWKELKAEVIPLAQPKPVAEAPLVRGIMPRTPVPASRPEDDSYQMRESPRVNAPKAEPRGGFIKQLWSSLFGSPKAEEPVVQSTASPERKERRNGEGSGDRQGTRGGRGGRSQQQQRRGGGHAASGARHGGEHPSRQKPPAEPRHEAAAEAPETVQPPQAQTTDQVRPAQGERPAEGAQGSGGRTGRQRSRRGGRRRSQNREGGSGDGAGRSGEGGGPRPQSPGQSRPEPARVAAEGIESSVSGGTGRNDLPAPAAMPAITTAPMAAAQAPAPSPHTAPPVTFAAPAGSMVEPVKPDFRPNSLHSAVTSPREHERPAAAPAQASAAAEPRSPAEAPRQEREPE